MKTVVTKGEFARLKSRSPACITKWIAEKKISPDALIGEGHRARIWVERAEADLRVGLDPAQQAGQERPVEFSAPSSASLAIDPVPLAPRRLNDDDEDLRRRRKADADKAEHDAEAARRRLAVDEGRWIEAAAATREWGKQLAELVGGIETFLFTTLARELSDRHGLDWKLLSVEIKTAFRKHRGQVAAQAREARELREADLADASADEGAPEMAEAAE